MVLIELNWRRWERGIGMGRRRRRRKSLGSGLGTQEQRQPWVKRIMIKLDDVVLYIPLGNPRTNIAYTYARRCEFRVDWVALGWLSQPMVCRIPPYLSIWAQGGWTSHNRHVVSQLSGPPIYGIRTWFRSLGWGETEGFLPNVQLTLGKHMQHEEQWPQQPSNSSPSQQRYILVPRPVENWGLDQARIGSSLHQPHWKTIMYWIMKISWCPLWMRWWEVV